MRQRAQHPAPDRPALFTPRFAAGAVANATMSFAFFLYMSSIAGFSLDVLHVSQTAAGILSGSFVVAAVVGRVITGPLTTLVGRRKTLFVMVGALIVANLGYLVGDTYGQIIAARIVHGIATGTALTAIGAVTLSATPPERQAEASGWFGTGMALASGLGPFAANLLIRTWGYTGVFVCGFALSFVTLALTWGALVGVPRRPSGRRFLRPPLTPSTFVAPRAFPIGFIGMLPAFGFAAVLTYLRPFAAESGLERWGALYFLVYSAVIVVSRPVAGIIQDRRGNDVVIVPIIAAAALGLAATAWSPNGPVLLVGAFCLGLGYGTLVSAGQAVAISRVGPLDIGLAVGSFFIFVDGGTGLGPMVLGGVAQHWGYRTMLWVSVALAIVALVLYVAFVSDAARRRRRARAGQGWLERRRRNRRGRVRGRIRGK